VSRPEVLPLALPARAGPRPVTSQRIPHSQLDQQPNARIQAQLARRISGFPGAEERASGISVPGARALCLPPGIPAGPPEAFLIDREFAHLHPVPDSSLHLSLPVSVAGEAVAAGWAEFHPLAGSDVLPPTIVMVYSPHEEEGREIFLALFPRSYDFATAKPA
jgi:Luciferase